MHVAFARPALAGGQRRGYTLVEVLTVIAVIGMLVALLIPAVQSARESVRNAQCKHNLRQIGLALAAYAQLHGDRLPAVWRTPRAKEWDNFSWRAAILPHLEQQALYDRIHWESPPLDPVNIQTSQIKLLVFQCPSTPGYQRAVESLGYADGVREGVNAGANDYAAVYAVANSGFMAYVGPGHGPLPSSRSVQRGPSEISGGSQQAGAWFGGPDGALNADVSVLEGTPFRDLLSYQRYLRTVPSTLRNVTDGLSNTALVVEQSGRPEIYSEEEETLTARESDDLILNPEEPRVEGLDPLGFLLASQGAWATADSSAFAGAKVNQDNRLDPYAFHRGVNVLMCDGSVHRWNQSLPSGILSALLSRDGDEIVERFDW